MNPGEAITATYTQSLWPTLNRRSHLNAVKHFWCQCQRCADAGELGTDLAGLRCATCADLVLSDDPLDPAAAWSCRRCRRPVSAAQAAVRHEQVTLGSSHSSTFHQVTVIADLWIKINCQISLGTDLPLCADAIDIWVDVYVDPF